MIYRIIDANLNRYREACRVVEDIVRFYLDNEPLTEEVKRIRHDIVNSYIKTIEKNDMISCRNSFEDVGKKLNPDYEFKRDNIEEVLYRNIARISESLRSLEEVTKCFNQDLSVKVKQARYEIYNLEQKINAILNINKLFEKISLYALTQEGDENTVLKQIETWLKNGIKLIQLRQKKSSDRELLKLACLCMEIIKQYNGHLIINDRIDIALACKADGVHLGLDDIPVEEAKKITPPSFIIGATVRNVNQAVEKQQQGATYVAVGPLYETRLKPQLEPRGIKVLEDVIHSVKIPVVTIGGINSSNLVEVLKTGVAGVALMSGVEDEAELKKIKKIYESFLGDIDEQSKR